MSKELRMELSNYFDCCLGESSYRENLDEWELAERLERKGYCSEPFLEYEKALCCLINKRKEKDCLMSSCSSHTFCMLLRREGYLDK